MTEDLARPRSLSELFDSAFRLYGRYPLLFTVLAAAVVVPYELIVLALTRAAPFGQQHTTASTALTLSLIDFVIVVPLVSALHVDAVSLIADGQTPKLGRVTMMGVRALPVVAAAQIIAGIAIGVGFIALIIPGVLLAVRFSVVAQAAAVERTTWIDALRRSGELARGSYWHILGLLVILAFASAIIIGIGQAIAGTSDHAGPVVIGLVVETLVRSFTALSSAVLFFDLRARARQAPLGS